MVEVKLAPGMANLVENDPLFSTSSNTCILTSTLTAPPSFQANVTTRSRGR